MLNNEQPSERDSLERLLGSFVPVPAHIDRDQLLFQAGMRAAQAAVELPSSRLSTRLWPALALFSTVAALILAIVAWQRPARIVVVERPATIAPDTPVPARHEEKVAPEHTFVSVVPLDPSANYLLQRERVLRDGPDALRQDAPEGDSYPGRATLTQQQLLQELPGEFRRSTYQVDAGTWWQPWLNPGDRS